jgi:hypothetical protein
MLVLAGEHFCAERNTLPRRWEVKAASLGDISYGNTGLTGCLFFSRLDTMCAKEKSRTCISNPSDSGQWASWWLLWLSACFPTWFATLNQPDVESFPRASCPPEKMTEIETAHDTQRWDFFIAHAREDKDTIAQTLAEALTAAGVSVCYDGFSLRPGESLPQCIDRGLACSKQGIVILSSYFLEKNWPQRELDALATRVVNGKNVILAVWHGVGFSEVREHSLTLADRTAVSTAKGLDYAVQRILEAAK